MAHIVEEGGFALSIDDTTQVLKALKKLFLSRSNPFGDIASDGPDAIATALSNLHLAEAGNTSGKLALIGNAKTDTNKCAVIVKTGSNANGKYRIWSDGSIDMWGNG
ncbi:gp53-like domain-containing protein, partial [Citrobacter farmeri]